MVSDRITKQLVDSKKPGEKDYYVFDCDTVGFGLRVRATGGRSYIVQYKAGAGRGAPTRRVTIGQVGKMTPDEARQQAKRILGSVAHGKDPAVEKRESREAATIAEIAIAYLAQHVEAKRKPKTVESYKNALEKHVAPRLGSRRALTTTAADFAKLHLDMAGTPYAANTMLRVVSSMFSWAAKQGSVPKGFNPVAGIEKFPESAHERFLTSEELERLGAAILEGETKGIPWAPDPAKKIKHAPKSQNRSPIRFGPYVAAAFRLLLLTGARLREILHAEWSQVDLERGFIFLPDSKTGKKPITLNAPAAAILHDLPRIGRYLIAGESAGTENERPRSDLKRPWAAVLKRAGLSDVRLHDLRHTHASVGVGMNLGLPVVGKLLGHTQARTTQRYAHLEVDVTRRASESIGKKLTDSLAGKKPKAPAVGRRR
jgi:integrase